MGLDQLENELDTHNPLERLTPLTIAAGVPTFYLYGDAK
jgi:hypothetical protein